MRWFTRTRSGFPADMRQRLELLGRFQLDTRGSGISPGEVWPTAVAPFMRPATDDPDGFLAALRAFVAGDRGGFATLGAACLVWEAYGSRALNMPAALPLIDAGIDFKIARGLSTGNLTGYEMNRLVKRGEQRAESPPSARPSSPEPSSPDQPSTTEEDRHGHP
jgi:hypothetical protein